jgi:hypothetical protein
MSTTQVQDGAPTAGQESLRARFAALSAQWKAGVGSTSSARAMSRHPAYRSIVALGDAAVPLILEELAREPHHWFAALREITGADPIPPEARGDVKRMAEAWLEWGRSHGRG